jgi:hypothetical protein
VRIRLGKFCRNHDLAGVDQSYVCVGFLEERNKRRVGTHEPSRESNLYLSDGLSDVQAKKYRAERGAAFT